MTPLERFLALAAMHSDEASCYADLMAGCPWAKAVHGGENPTDFSMCQPATGKGGPPGVIVKMSGKPQTLEEAHYRATDSKLESCFTCEYSANWQGKDGHCKMFDAPISRGHTCDEWEGKKKGVVKASGSAGPNDYGAYETTGRAADSFSRARLDSRGASVSLTPHTAEASTVHKPTVPPGGPGLFHHKGLQLPPYIQHVWHHLAPKYGKQKAYAMAVGIVKKWAQGINPGGKEPTKTHADVRAAAARNVAEWERDKHMGGNKGG